MTPGVLVIPSRLHNGRDGNALAGHLTAELRAQMLPAGSEPPTVVLMDDNDRVVCDCQPYAETGECEHWHEIGR